jgi:hypothetical protein
MSPFVASATGTNLRLFFNYIEFVFKNLILQYIFERHSGQSQFASLKLRSLALVPSSGAQSRPFELHLWQLHCKTLPSAPGAPVRDLRPFRAPASPVSMRRAATRLSGISIRKPVQ